MDPGSIAKFSLPLLNVPHCNCGLFGRVTREGHKRGSHPPEVKKGVCCVSADSREKKQEPFLWFVVKQYQRMETKLSFLC